MIRLALALAVAGAVGVLLAVSAGAGAGASIAVALSPTQEVPPVRVAAAKGRFTATLTGSALAWKVSFSGLTGPATAAHVHIAARGTAGPVTAPLCGPCRSGQGGTARLTAAALAALATGRLYVNVHTAAHAGGEIRGQLPKVAAAASSGGGGGGGTTPTDTGSSGGGDPGYGY